MEAGTRYDHKNGRVDTSFQPLYRSTRLQPLPRVFFCGHDSDVLNSVAEGAMVRNQLPHLSINASQPSSETATDKEGHESIETGEIGASILPVYVSENSAAAQHHNF